MQHQTPMGNILVTDGRQRSTLALTRSLGRRGIEVTVGDERLPCLASASRYSRDSFAYVSPVDEPSGFVESLIHQLRKKKYDLLMPMTDITSYVVGQHREQLSRLVDIPMVERSAFELASDKAEMVRLAQQLNIPVPETLFVDSIEDARKLAPSLKYPVVVKPRRSRYLVGSRWVATGVRFAHTPDELVAQFATANSSIPLPLIQKRVKGPGCGAFLLFDHGQPLAVFFHRRLREKPPSGGVSVLRESIPAEPQMKHDAEKLLSHLGWHGVAMVEFKKDESDGQFKLMEINARFWGSLQLAIDAGVDFPYLLYQMATGERPQPQFEYKAGIKSRWFFGDLDHTLARLFKSNRNLNLPENFPGRLATLYNFLKLWQKDTKYEIFRCDDIRPALHEAKEYARALIAVGER